MSSRPTFEQAWSVIADIAKGCREFNELQFKYRQLAFSLVLAAYAAIGYFWSNAEFPKKAEVAPNTVQNLTGPYDNGPNASASIPSARAAAKQQSESAGSHDKSAQDIVGRLHVIFLGIGLLTAFSALMIYNIDARYHGLLQANFKAASEFETSMDAALGSHAPPQIHRRMEAAVQHLHIVRPMLTFYAVASLSALVPWGSFVWSHWGEMKWTTNYQSSVLIFGTLGIIAFVCGLFYGVIYARVRFVKLEEVQPPAGQTPATVLPQRKTMLTPTVWSALKLVGVAMALAVVVIPWIVFMLRRAEVEQSVTDSRFLMAALAGVGVVDFICGILCGILGTRLVRNEPQGSTIHQAAPIRPLSTPMALAAIEAQLLHVAVQAHANAYAVHSHFDVGAAVLASNGTDQKIFGGCNVENVSYGLTLCAERNAIAAAVAAGYRQIEKVFIYTDTPAPTVPCGACRQVIAEFGPKAEIIAQTAGAARSAKHIDALFPEPFKL